VKVLEGVLRRDLLGHALDADTSSQRQPVEGYGHIGIGLDLVGLATSVVGKEGESLGGGFLDQHIAIGGLAFSAHGGQGGGIGLQNLRCFQGQLQPITEHAERILHLDIVLQKGVLAFMVL